MTIVVATAGWSIPRQHVASFPEAGSTLQRYAARLRGVEINSSFYHPHRRGTWERWAASVPEDFRFAAKVPRSVTHERKLADCRAPLMDFSEAVQGLGSKLAILLVQLPPKLAFEEAVAAPFFALLGELTPADIVCEPRHISWFEPQAEKRLEELRVARAAADPALADSAARPGGWRGLSYWRLHGSPVMYRSPYGDARLADYARRIEADRGDGTAWCVFDNTASSAAMGDALGLIARLDEPSH